MNFSDMEDQLKNYKPGQGQEWVGTGTFRAHNPHRLVCPWHMSQKDFILELKKKGSKLTQLDLDTMHNPGFHKD